jgi:hypothetical protein
MLTSISFEWGREISRKLAWMAWVRGRWKRQQDKANFGSPVVALASVCLHIGFFTLDRHFSGTLQGA